MTQFSLLDIDGYFLLFCAFEDVKHVAEEDEPHPRIVFLLVLRQQFQVLFDHRVEENQFRYLFFGVFAVSNDVGVVSL